jgi:hypothetical protein
MRQTPAGNRLLDRRARGSGHSFRQLLAQLDRLDAEARRQHDRQVADDRAADRQRRRPESSAARAAGPAPQPTGPPPGPTPAEVDAFVDRLEVDPDDPVIDELWERWACHAPSKAAQQRALGRLAAQVVDAQVARRAGP